MNKQMDRRKNGRKNESPAVFYKTSSPLRPLPKNIKKRLSLENLCAKFGVAHLSCLVVALQNIQGCPKC